MTVRGSEGVGVEHFCVLVLAPSLGQGSSSWIDRTSSGTASAMTKPGRGGVVIGEAGSFHGQRVNESLILLDLVKAGDPAFKFGYFLS